MRFSGWVCALVLAGSAFSREPVHARSAMVVTQDPLATDVGVSILKSGGNAIDAAVAIGFALAVTYPYAGNIGGGGFMLIRMADGRTNFIDFRESAPLSSTADMYLDSAGNVTKDTLVGWRAAGVPGTVRGFELALRKYGKKSWAGVLQPAIGLAQAGYPVSWFMQESLATAADKLAQFPDSKRIFGGLKFGDKLVQPELASTLKRLRDHGASDFYEGEIAHKIASEMASHGGLITLGDLEHYRPIERAPLQGSYEGYDIITAPPPSSGGIGVLQMLGMLEGSSYQNGGAGSASVYHYLAEVMRRYFADRAEFLGDPDFVKVPVKQLLDPHYIQSRRDTIEASQATPSRDVHAGPLPRAEPSETTHYNVIDADGNVAEVTYTLNAAYGSGVTVPGLGFLLNDEMDDFTAKPGVPNLFGLIQGEGNKIQPGKRPLSAMTPTLLLHNGKPFLALGSPGGSRIITGVLQAILNVVDFHMNVQDAVDWPRVHHQWMPDILYVDRGVSPDTAALLRKMGYDTDDAETTTSVHARVQAILVSDRSLEGACDERGPGKAEGY